MNKKSIILTLFSLLVLILAVVIFTVFNINEFWPSRWGNNNTTTTEDSLIGGQRDKYGCLIAAGYSWCESKHKCLRAWEEPCVAEEALKNYLRDNISSLSPEKEVLGGNSI